MPFQAKTSETHQIEARKLLARLTAQTLRTLTYEKPNTVMGLEGSKVRVRTNESPPDGRLAPVAYVQEAIDTLYREGELRIDKATLGHRRTAFVGAVLREIPGVEVLTRPQRVRLKRN